MADRATFRVLGQIEGLSFSELTIWAEDGLVCMQIRGAGESAYATAPPDLAQAIVGQFRASIREAAGQLPPGDYSGGGERM